MGVAAQVFPPGDFLKEEMEARGWTQVELAEVMGRPTKVVNEIVAGKKAVTPETAIQLADALGTSPELWMNLETTYQLSKVQARSGVVSKRAALYKRFPVREMLKREWVEATDDVEELTRRFLAFFQIPSLDEVPSFRHVAKKTEALEPATYAQLAWLFRARQLALSAVFRKYSREKFIESLPLLSNLRTAPEEVRHAPKILADCGVRLVYVEALPGSKIDGACFWLDNDQPVIAMSLRQDRIDNYWFVLRHEAEHVLREHGKDSGYVIDQDIEKMDSSQIVEEERQANDAAAEFCVPQAQLADFIARVNPYFSEERVSLFARRLGIHVGVVAGQLRKKLGRWDRWTHHLAKIKDIAIKSAPVDGWGLVEHS
jgi:HTH-type transcriptional regulator / antitoxin HigA